MATSISDVSPWVPQRGAQGFVPDKASSSRACFSAGALPSESPPHPPPPGGGRCPFFPLSHPNQPSTSCQFYLQRHLSTQPLFPRPSHRDPPQRKPSSQVTGDRAFLISALPSLRCTAEVSRCWPDYTITQQSSYDPWNKDKFFSLASEP